LKKAGVFIFLFGGLVIVSKVRKLVFTGVCIALGLSLPLVLHGIPGGGNAFLPMHIPVLLCGLVCGWPFGLACGVLTPLLSALLTGMPPAPILPGMTGELAVYGLVAGLLIGAVKGGNKTANIYVALIGAMVCGRIAGGLLNGLIFRAGEYTLGMWVTASFVTGIPGIIAQLVLIPLLVALLRRSGVIE
jgi:niacin transporter